MKFYKIFAIGFLVLGVFCFSVQAQEKIKILVPEEASFTDRFIFSELQSIRTKQDTLKQEIYSYLQNQELSVIDRALSYSSHTLNFFFIFLSVAIVGIGVFGWKTFADIRSTLQRNIERESQKILQKFQSKMDSIEKDQKINILWRNFSFAEIAQEKLDILDKIRKIKPNSLQVMIERSNTYLEMELYSKVVEVCDEILAIEPEYSQAILNRAMAYISLKKSEEALNDIEYLLKISPDYRDVILEKDIFKSLATKIEKIS